MTEKQNQQTIYTAYLAFKATENYGALPEDKRACMAEEAEAVLDKAKENEITTRGVYLTTGFRADTDFMLWWIAPSPDAIQAGLRLLHHTELGQRSKASWSFMGLHRPAEFHRDHAPAFVKGEPPKHTICVYPFTRTPEWYLLPPDKRRELLTSHGGLGEDFGDILTNTTMAFGLGDDEWMLAFEAEELGRIVDMVRKLREAEARLYTLREVPFITGIRTTITEVINSL